MAIDSILAQIDAEIASLTQVRSLLTATGKFAAKTTERITEKAAKPAKTKKRRKMSAAARKRIGDAQRKRWAAQKSKGK